MKQPAIGLIRSVRARQIGAAAAAALLVLALTLALAACAGQGAGEVTIRLREMRFDAASVQVRAGEPVTLRLVNQDGYQHAFDLDAFDIHLPLPAEARADVRFTPTEPGRYTFYCGSPGHEAAGMTGTLIVTP